MSRQLIFAAAGVLMILLSSSPSQAQTCAAAADCADLDGNLIRDDGCVWWGCVEGQCTSIDIHFGDMKGNELTCEPDGSVDGNDAGYGALYCFSNFGYSGRSYEEFPCEDNAPQALNVDAGGRFGSCAPDGVCDVHDRYHAMNANSNTSGCTCPLDDGSGPMWPAPTAHPQVRVFLAAEGHQSTAPNTGSTILIMEPDTTATVMVWADVRGPAGDAQLESYQIVLEDNAAPLNGATGTVGYVDVNPHENGGDSLFIDKARSDWIFAGVPAAATPVYYGETQLGFFGVIYPNLSSAAIAPPEGIHYLASFDIQASADAMGEFTLHFVRETIPGFPRPWADLIHPYGYEYPVEEWQPLTIFVVGKSPCIEFTECADQNGDEVRDDGCTWWACDNGFCQPVAIAFADVGGSFGLCAPDGVVDGNDRFHILNCFSNQTTVGQSGYPCEANPPLALNVDAGGAFGSCAPDGVCDGNDAFHALNAFSGETACSCPAGGPAPSGPAVVKDALVRGDTAPIVDSAEIALVAGRQTMRPGELVEVDVVLASPLADLRGYQLHLGTSGGKSGALELVDISIRQPSVFTTPNDGAGLKPMRAGLKPAPTNKTGPTAPADATAPTSAATAATAPTSPIAPAAATSPSAAWSAFNLRTQQMLAGLDGPGVAAPEGAYLATFTYRASADAAGTFTVELLHDSSDRSHRTFLFPTGANGGIDIRGAASASVNVTAARDRR